MTPPPSRSAVLRPRPPLGLRAPAFKVTLVDCRLSFTCSVEATRYELGWLRVSGARVRMRRSAFWTLLLLLSSSGTVAARTPCPAQFFRGNAPVILNPHLADNTREICYRSFSVSASALSRTGLWSAEHLTRTNIAMARNMVSRHGHWHADTHLRASERADPKDYTNSGYDRGHLSPSGDMPTLDADAETFTMANVAPQVAHLNRGSWERAENLTRDIATYLGEAWVVTGVIFKGKNLRQIAGGVLVPTSFFKALLMPGRGAAAYVATNEAQPKWEVISIAELTRRSGIDAFPALAASVKTTAATLPTIGARRPRQR